MAGLRFNEAEAIKPRNHGRLDAEERRQRASMRPRQSSLGIDLVYLQGGSIVYASMRPRQSSLGIDIGIFRPLVPFIASMRPRQSSLGI